MVWVAVHRSGAHQPASGSVSTDSGCASPLRSVAVDGERVVASHAQGVLTLRILVAQQAKPRRVEVTAGTDARSAVSRSG